MSGEARQKKEKKKEGKEKEEKKGVPDDICMRAEAADTAARLLNFRGQAHVAEA